MNNTIYSLCSPWFDPQIVGGELPPGLSTLNWSTRHWVAVDAPVPLPVEKAGCPKTSLCVDVVVVSGPLIRKLSKSRRS